MRHYVRLTVVIDLQNLALQPISLRVLLEQMFVAFRFKVSRELGFLPCPLKLQSEMLCVGSYLQGSELAGETAMSDVSRVHLPMYNHLHFLISTRSLDILPKVYIEML